MPPPHPLLQAAEVTKVAVEAAGAVTHHAADSGPAFALLWFLVVSLTGICFAFYLKSEKATKGQQEYATKAVADARQEWARQQAFDNGHAADLLKQSREQEKEALDRLEAINRELRQQDKESVKVIGSVGTALNGLTSIMQGIQFQLITIETILTGRPAHPPRQQPPFNEPLT